MNTGSMMRSLVLGSIICTVSLFASELVLPQGLGGLSSQSTQAKGSSWYDDFPMDYSGHVEFRTGVRLGDYSTDDPVSLGELRIKNDVSFPVGPTDIELAGDIVWDAYYPETLEVNQGKGFFDLRKASFFMSPFSFMDLKVGRQVLTWGTGDLLFINDLFPKDWNSFMLGRDSAYLKAPSDAVRVSVFLDAFNVDVAYTPQFDSDRFIDGSRVSYYNPGYGRIVGRDVSALDVQYRDQWFEEDEVALRVSTLFNSVEYAGYFYSGFWKSPNSQNDSSQAIFAPLSVLGASVRSPLLGGIGALEVGYYDSLDDQDGSDASIENSQVRLLVSYEKEIVKNVTTNLQYYLESMLDHDAYIAQLSDGDYERDEHRHVVTIRVTSLMYRQRLVASFFNFYSPSDQDGYLRSSLNYTFSDVLSMVGGVNVFYGEHEETFFNQFHHNTNVYMAVTRAF